MRPFPGEEHIMLLETKFESGTELKSNLEKTGLEWCRMDLPGPTTSVGTWADYSVGPWDYPACATWHLMA
jgi:hypothetical protein